MRQIITLAAVLISLAFSAFGQGERTNGAESGKIIEEVKKAASELSEAIARRDENALKLILADDYTFVHSTGNVDDKTLRIEKIKANKLPTIESSSRDNVRYRVYDKTVVISSDTRQKSELNGIKREIHLRGIMVWVKNQGCWQLVAQQSTRIQPERTAITLEPKILDLYVGQYELAPNLFFTVTREGNSVFGQQTNGRKLDLTAESETKFFVEGLNAQIQFYKNEKGAFDSVGIRIGTGQEMIGKKVK
ncbi:MAG: DUF4440 domain-containing protein [Acidobacteria bacterium]|nr:DUF4440 domain-containing protein [Acidobacteriota bacterium]MCA1637540.1 DUF4440 domain-containing protein [Acidobacteriota bacterium]